MRAPATRAERTLEGRHVLAMFVGGFSVIVAVNATLAVSAVRTFPGTETASSYVASQTFDADRAAQEALGWDVTATLAPDALRIEVAGARGAVVRPEVVAATLGRATTTADDLTPAFDWDGAAWVAPVDAGPGNWNLRVEMRAPDGTPFRRRIPLRVAR